MWQKFGEIQRNKLPDLWNEFLERIDCAEATVDPLFHQLTSETLVELLIKDRKDASKQLMPRHEPEVSLSRDEENIIRYACGYVGMKLHKKFVVQDGRKAKLFVNCLDKMRADASEDSTESLLNYTKEWTDKVNRGGLFEVSDESFQMFLSLEVAIRRKLENRLTDAPSLSSFDAELQSGQDDGKMTIIRSAMTSPKITYYWKIVFKISCCCTGWLLTPSSYNFYVSVLCEIFCTFDDPA